MSRPGDQDVRDRRADHRAEPGVGAGPAEDRAGQGRCAGKPAEMIMSPPAAKEPIERSADHAVTELHSAHYRTLVRLAGLLVQDTPTAEEIVQDSFAAMHGSWQRLRDDGKALTYLRRTVVNRSRSVLRHRAAADQDLQEAPPNAPSAQQGTLMQLERPAVTAALRGLPGRQREAIVLRTTAICPKRTSRPRCGSAAPR
jgi:RNA polymerase sigma factor (sigma-70 family)